MIYFPEKLGGWNEDESARVFLNFANELASYKEKSDAVRISQWITLTKNHDHKAVEDVQTDDGHYLFDIDLSILASEPEAYDE